MLTFSWKNDNSLLNLIDTQLSYKEITEKFCNAYYSLCDSDFEKLNNMYTSECMITYLGFETNGFANLVGRLKAEGIYKFLHDSINVTAQPIGKNGVYIMTTGILSLNYSFNKLRFSESFILVRDDYNNFFITNQVFNIIQ